MLPETAWKATLGELELQMTKATFNTWLKGARLIAYEDNEYVIGVRNDYAKDWLENRLRDTILRTLSAIAGEKVHVRFVVWSDEIITPAPPVLNQETEKVKERPYTNGYNGYTNGDNGSMTLNNRFTFSTFVVGSSNRLAHAAALSVAENPGQTYNPLFVYGGVGLGKTHLLHAIGHKCLQDGRVVRYISSETFTNDLVQSIRNKQMDQFRERYRTVDVLMIDDIQFIAGKESTQEELFHTFNELHSQGKQVIISSDRPPKAMMTLEERLQSRFEWGLMADIQQPDLETRKAILQTKAEDNNVYIPDHILEFIAQHVHKNIRELEGALNKVTAYANLSGRVIDEDLVNMALADLIRQPEKLTLEQVVQAVCDHYKVTMEELAGLSRKRAIAFPRQMAMYLARSETDASLPLIGTYLGNRDHSTVLYGYEKVASLLETDASIRRNILEIKASLYESAQVAV
ncbi:MAG: chromosomal replication initiator protein DnaA [Ardenticatenaceae bacterium]|nr:chromosomal replication initiator protein DnaA [Anaerolineales bacterium]MCB8920465.1 chromosomal replication initiator protein DnaA [Ardenticatenaceae bacterium]MCB8989420.1 chromosomal replication initiator protein DnaA [Ardenticatenaceae bacterium]MCB9004575.1 chromosomal replication initiator protein DnaA [Ardenticatenaceae bacterium]